MILLGTRKGLLQLEEKKGGGFELVRESFTGVPVPYAFLDERTGTLWASLDHGHWGVKLNRSKDLGKTWEEIAAPKYPDDAEVKDGKKATLELIWYIAPGTKAQPQRLYFGTNP